MSGFLGRMAARASVATMAVSPRVPSRFEHGGGGAVAERGNEGPDAVVAARVGASPPLSASGVEPRGASGDRAESSEMRSPARQDGGMWGLTGTVRGQAQTTSGTRAAHGPGRSSDARGRHPVTSEPAAAEPAGGARARGGAVGSGSAAATPTPARAVPAEGLRARPTDAGHRADRHPGGSSDRDTRGAAREPDVIHVSIGRVDVRAVLAPAVPPSSPPRRAAPRGDQARPLQDYLRGRESS